jgi:hypothetical protein
VRLMRGAASQRFAALRNASQRFATLRSASQHFAARARGRAPARAKIAKTSRLWAGAVVSPWEAMAVQVLRFCRLLALRLRGRVFKNSARCFGTPQSLSKGSLGGAPGWRRPRSPKTSVGAERAAKTDLPRMRPLHNLSKGSLGALRNASQRPRGAKTGLWGRQDGAGYAPRRASSGPTRR